MLFVIKVIYGDQVGVHEYKPWWPILTFSFARDKCNALNKKRPQNFYWVEPK